MPISATLLHLLKASKSENPPLTFCDLKKTLAPLYSDEMTLHDVLTVLSEYYLEALAEPKLKISSNHEAFTNLLLSPIQSHFNFTKPVDLNSNMSIQDYYDNIIAHIINKLRFSNKSLIPEISQAT